MSEIRSARVACGLAPMEGISDLPTRVWFAAVSAPLAATTPFLRITKDLPVKRLPKAFAPELEILRGAVSYELTPQLMASDPYDFLRFAEALLERGAPRVELNCGCPAPVVVGHGAGSGLLETPEKFFKFLKPIAETLGSSFAVKIRTGFASDAEFEGLLEVLNAFSLNRLTIHGRTRADRYTGKARWHLIDRASRLLPYPVWGSGDVNDSASLEDRLVSAKQVSGVIVGRGALRLPWLFSLLGHKNSAVLPYSVFRSSLEYFALLQEIYFRDAEALIAWCKEYGAPTALMNEDDSWARSIALLKESSWTREHAREVSRGTLCKLKMLWNYLRSSLPEEFFDAALLRAGDVKTFFELLDSKAHGTEVEIKYNSAHDWIYAGGGKNGERKTGE